MEHLSDGQPRQPHARWLAASMIAACTGAVLIDATALPVDNTVGAAASAYTVVNVGVSSDEAFLNQRGQVAYSIYNDNHPINGFFDGKRRYDIAAPGGRYTYVRGLNNFGVVVGEFDDATVEPPYNERAFTWTVGRGLRALPGGRLAVAVAINDRNQAVGSIHGDALYFRAHRWNPDGTQIDLGPLPASIGQATAINDSGVAVGVADVAQHDSHAMVWDAAGMQTDLGQPGFQSVARFVNANSQVAGYAFYNRGGLEANGFLWSRTGGMVKILPFGWDNVTIDALNDAGQVAGNRRFSPGDLIDHFTPFIWCLEQGARLLPVGSAANARVLALNNRSEMVGFTEQTAGDASTRHAVRWNDTKSMVDLNTRLYHAPAGLVLTSARAINNRGIILAESNAGLVLLRPWKDPAAAPVLGPVTRTTPGQAIALNGMADFVVNFVGSNATKAHTASATVDDGCPQTAPSLREVRGQGDVSLRHVFCKAGTFTVKIAVADGMGNVAEVQHRQSVGDPAVSTPKGQGTRSGQSAQPAKTGDRP